MEDLEVIVLVNRHNAEVEFYGFSQRLSAISAKRKPSRMSRIRKWHMGTSQRS